jgi:hypothetical protein
MTRFIFRLFLCCACLAPVVRTGAQSAGTIFPGLAGAELLDSLYAAFKPVNVLPYSMARDTLFARVFAIDDDSLRCLYSGYVRYLDPTQDPTTYVYLDGLANGMNTEHAYPQSKGASEGNARSDMHHLFPTRNAVNSARANSPFAEIPDQWTEKWFYRDQVMSLIPTVNKHLYSESTGEQFEPREDAKGNVARAIFYFYTMYKSQAVAADPAFFELQRPTLCQWHEQDPADQLEQVHSWRIAAYQDGKPNPYALDCTLARRAYCPELTAVECLTVGTGAGPDPAAAFPVQVRPNPFGSAATVELILPFPGALRLRLLTLLGREVATFRADAVPAGAYSYRLELDSLPVRGAWVGLLEVQLTAAQGTLTRAVRIIRHE